MMVIYSSTGMSNTDIAEKYGYGAQQISNILNTRQAKELQERLATKNESSAIDAIPAKMEAIAIKTIDRLHTMMDDDDLFFKAPIALIDRGFRMAEQVKIMKAVAPPSAAMTQNNIIISPEAAKHLETALAKAEEVRLIHSGN
jgi:hypothetical protein